MNNEKNKSKFKIIIPIIVILSIILGAIVCFIVCNVTRHDVSEKDVINYLQKKYSDDEFSNVKLIDNKTYNYRLMTDGASNGRTLKGLYDNEFIQIYEVYSNKLDMKILVQHYKSIPTVLSWIPRNNMKDNYEALEQSKKYQTIIERYLGKCNDINIDSQITTHGAKQMIKYTYKRNKDFNENEYDILAFIDKQTKDYKKINQINNDIVGTVVYYVEYNDITFVYNPQSEYSTNEKVPCFYFYSKDNKRVYLDDKDLWNKINTLRGTV